MTEAPKRDPLSVVLQLLTLGVLAWIGFGISNLPERTAPVELDFDRLVTVLDERLGRNSGVGPVVEATAPRPNVAQADPRPETAAPSRRRLVTPRTPAPVTESLHDLEPDAPRESRVKTMIGIRTRLDLSDDARHRAKKEFLLLGCRALVRRLGRPDNIDLSQNGASEYWAYLVAPDRQITFTIRNGYVTNLW